jgi:diguanylate cyclase (GGDEF)-like protein
MTLENETLGTITLTRQFAFTPQEIITIENALHSLSYPLRNALQYHVAIVNSLTCGLTLLGNRKAYDKAIVREIEFSKRHLSPFSLLIVDVDHFKRINDTYGHQAGDHFLQQLAKLITQLGRNSDTTFRYGGEEFAIILNHTQEQGALFVANRICQQIENADLYYQEKRIPITVSIGIATYQENDTAEKIFERADSALYRAKKGGRNQALCFGL